MPPKKRRKQASRKTTTDSRGGSAQPKYMWLLKYESGGRYYELERHEALFSTKEKAIAAMPDFMCIHAAYGDDWKNGLEGFGREDEDPYLGFEYFGDSLGLDGGELLSNSHSDRRNPITVILERLRIDPPM